MATLLPGEIAHLSELLAAHDLEQWALHKRLYDARARLRAAEVEPQQREKRRRVPNPRGEPRDTAWWRMYVDSATVRDPEHADHSLFRRRFRVPYSLYETLLAHARSKAWFPDAGHTDAFGRSAYPLELKVLGFLRVLGRGWAFDDVAEATDMSEETHRRFFHEFAKKFAEDQFEHWVHPPRDDEELADWMREYTEAGFPGAFGSVDGVHILWEKCSSQLKNLCKGKEAYCTLAYNVTVNHRRQIISCTNGFYGSHNDKTMARWDSLTQEVKTEARYKNFEYDLRREDGTTYSEKGVYLLCDGGYHRWRCLQCPIKHPTTLPDARWSKWLESMRKDVECTFGILKGRFRILKTGMRVALPETIDNVMHTCCILHNMLLHHDGRDEAWEHGVMDAFAAEEGYHEVDDMVAVFARIRRLTGLREDPAFQQLRFDGALDLTVMGCRQLARVAAAPAGGGDDDDDDENDDEETQRGHFDLRAKLITHFTQQHAGNNIRWPSRNGAEA
jgi:hypothetical protein